MKYYFVTIRWDWVTSACIVYAKTRASAMKKAKKKYPAYEIRDAAPYTFIK
jgi:hypothetical protein